MEGGLVTGATILRRESGVTETVRARSSWWPTARTPASAGPSAPPGTARYPMGMAIRGYFTSPFHDEPWIESHLDLRDRDGNHLPGYGWIFPVGDGTVNVGAGLLDTFTGFKSVNTSKLMDAFVRDRPRPLGDLARDVLRAAGRRQAPHRRLGDARRPAPPGSSPATPPGSINPFNGEGISYAYETGRMVADAVHEALDRRRARAGRATRTSSRRSTARTSRWRGPS